MTKLEARSTELSVYDCVTLGNRVICWYCGETTWRIESDHFYPKSKGGRLKVKCCTKCNREKKDFTPLQWITHLKHRLTYYNVDTVSGKETSNKINRMLTATESLWERVKWSIKNRRTIFCSAEECVFNKPRDGTCTHYNPQIPRYSLESNERDCKSFTEIK